MKKIAIIVLSLSVMSAHAGFLKKVIIAGAATYAGHSIAKKIEAKKEEKNIDKNADKALDKHKVESANKDIAR